MYDPCSCRTEAVYSVWTDCLEGVGGRKIRSPAFCASACSPACLLTWQAFRVETLLVCSVLCWPPRCTPGTVRTKLWNLPVCLKNLFYVPELERWWTGRKWRRTAGIDMDTAYSVLSDHCKSLVRILWPSILLNVGAANKWYTSF